MPAFGVKQGRPAGAADARRSRLRRLVGPLLLGAVAIEGSACAMQPVESPLVECSIEISAKLPPQLRQEAEICGPIARAAEAAARDAGLAAGAVIVKVELLSAYSITATTFVEGRALPQQRVDISDRPLEASAIDMLARAVASQLAQLRSNRS